MIPQVPEGQPLVAGVYEHAFCDAKSFLQALHPLSDLWRDSGKDAMGAWIFRGHADSDWKLLPTAHRDMPWLRFAAPEDSPFRPELAKESERLERESELLRLFQRAVDMAGLPGALNYEEFDSLIDATEDGWPHRDLVPLLALAQHYGVPTRLLDWTRQGRVAAYFAALSPELRDGRLAVWALHRGDLATLAGAHTGPELRVATAPRASNPNLHAQAGLFTYVAHAGSGRRRAGAVRAGVRRRDGDRSGRSKPPLKLPQPVNLAQSLLSLETIVSARAIELDSTAKCVMRKLTLPRSHADELLRLLHIDGVSALTMFPGLTGVSAYLSETFRAQVPQTRFW